MRLTMLKAKLHQARVTHAELEYEGSCAIDGMLLNLAGIIEFEQLHIYNIDNGERFTTYAIRAEERSKIISLNGAAARKVVPGDRIIICTYAAVEKAELASFKPNLVYLDHENSVIRCSREIAVQAA